MFSLEGKVALVTGSSKGIGKAIIEQMANAGAKVVVSSRKADACEAVRAEFAARGQEAIAVPCNVGQKEELKKLVDTVTAKWGRIDILVCNAATNIRTDFARALWEDETRRKAREALTPLRRIGEPKDIGGIAVFLASEAGSFITGQMIVADGGVTIAGERG